MLQDPVRSEELVVGDVVSAGDGFVGRTPWQLFWRRFKRDRVALAGGIIIICLIAIAILAPLIAKLVGHGPNELFDSATNEFGLPIGPSSKFWSRRGAR